MTLTLPRRSTRPPIATVRTMPARVSVTHAAPKSDHRAVWGRRELVLLHGRGSPLLKDLTPAERETLAEELAVFKREWIGLREPPAPSPFAVKIEPADHAPIRPSDRAVIVRNLLIQAPSTLRELSAVVGCSRDVMSRAVSYLGRILRSGGEETLEYVRAANGERTYSIRDRRTGRMARPAA